MATPAAPGAPSMMYCHACSRRFRLEDPGGALACPACQSDFVEVLEDGAGEPDDSPPPGLGGVAEQSAEHFLGTLRTALQSLHAGPVPLHVNVGMPLLGCAFWLAR